MWITLGEVNKMGFMSGLKCEKVYTIGRIMQEKGGELVWRETMEGRHLDLKGISDAGWKASAVKIS